jgi:hypothetical protein
MRPNFRYCDQLAETLPLYLVDIEYVHNGAHAEASHLVAVHVYVLCTYTNKPDDLKISLGNIQGSTQQQVRPLVQAECNYPV